MSTRGSFASAAVAAVVVVSLEGCGLLFCSKIYETRFVATTGTASSPAIGTITVVWLNLRDYSDEAETPVSVGWHIEGTGLVRQPTALSLRDVRDTSRVVAPIPIRVTGSMLSGSAFDLPNKADRDRVFSLLSGGNGVVVVDAPGAPRLLVRLTVTDREEWHRPRCD